MHFSEKGYNVLIPYMRATGEIEGEYIGMGWLDKEDLKCWIDLIIEQNRLSNNFVPTQQKNNLKAI
ncbi:MAG: hypothetical protein UGE22_03420 [Clostridia bacterium]|jgi:hypothetical protein|nr:hypothetical protein [Clostridia bacterium]